MDVCVCISMAYEWYLYMLELRGDGHFPCHGTFGRKYLNKCLWNGKVLSYGTFIKIFPPIG